MTHDRAAHWDAAYAARSPTDLMWHQDEPTPSLALIARSGVARDAPILDVGGGASRLAGCLLREGYTDISVFDLSAVALQRARDGMGAPAALVHWIVGDATDWQPDRRYALWHDRAAFHFLTGAAERAAYLETMHANLVPGGWAVIASFAADGPDRCSGLPVQRYDPADLAVVLGPRFTLVEGGAVAHQTPRGGTQAFQFSLFQRL